MLFFEIGRKSLPVLIDRFSSDSLVINDSHHFIDSGIIDASIILTPTVLTTLASVLHEILSYKNQKKQYQKADISDITIRMKNENDEFEIILRSSAFSSKKDLDNEINKCICRIKAIKKW